MSTLHTRALSVDAPVKRQWPDPALLVIYFGGCLILFITCALPVWHEVPKLSNFATFWASGNAANHGLNPYAVYPETLAVSYAGVGGPSHVPDLNLNPPCILPLFQILARLSLPKFSIVLTIVCFSVMIFTIGLILWTHPGMQKRQLAWLLFFTPTRECVGEGQIYFILFFLCAIAWILLERRTIRSEWLAAVAIGIVVAVKPTFAFWPLFLFLRGDRKQALRSTGVALIVSFAPALFYGLEIYSEWASALRGDLHWWSAGNIAIAPYFRRIGLHNFGIALSWGVAIALAAYIAKKQPARRSTTMIAVCAGILCPPLAWPNYSLLLAPGFVSHRWGWPSNLAALILALPQWLMIRMVAFTNVKTGWAIGSSLWFSVFWIILGVSLSRDLRTGGTPELTGDPMAAKLRSV